MVTVALLAAGCQVPRSTPPAAHLPEPLAAFGRLPAIEDVVVSPGGTQLAFVKTTSDGRRIIAVLGLADRRVLGTVQAGDAKIRDVRWLDDAHLLLATSTTGVPLGMTGTRVEWMMMQVYDLGPNTVRPLLTGTENMTMNVAFGRPMLRRVGGRTMLFTGGYYVKHQNLPALFQIDIDSGHEEMVREGSLTAREWLVDGGGAVVAEEDYDNRTQRWALRLRRGDSLDEVASGVDPFDWFDLVGFGPSGDTVLAEVFENGEWTGRALSLKDGSWGPRTVKGLGKQVVQDRLTDRVVGRLEADDEYRFFDDGLQQSWDEVARTFAGERVRLVSMSDDHAKLVVLVEGSRDGLAYQLVDTTAHQIEPIGNVYDGLPPPAAVKHVVYPAADGLSIPGYLTLPGGRAPTGLPLIVFPHGGPAVHDTGAFDWWAQALASRGYAVLQPNYRGSTISPQMLSAGFGEWGRKMQTDLSDGVRFLVREKIADPARVCIVGGSYGGYAALAGVTLDPGVYRCAVSVAGPADLKRFLEWVNERRGRENPAQRWWDRFLGVSGPSDPTLGVISPIDHVGAVSVPVMLIHGRDDTVVPYEQSERMAVALERAGKSVDLVPLDGEDHWLSRAATRSQMLEHVVAFLAKQNPPE